MKMSDKKPKLKIWIIVTVSAVAILLSVVALTQSLPGIRLSLAQGGQVSDGVLAGVDESLHVYEVPEGEIRYLINKKIVFESPYSQGDVMLENPESCVRIPMAGGIRSLNLSNAVAVGLYEVLRQWDYPALENFGQLHNYKWDD